MTDVDHSASQGAHASNGGSIKDVAGSAAQAAKSTANDLASTAKSKVSEQLGRGKNAIGTTMDELASAVRKAAEELNQHNQATVGRVVMQGADSLQSLSRSIAQKEPAEFLDTIRDFGRKNPVALVGGSILVGLAIARFAKSSQQSNGAGSNLPTTNPSTNSPSTQPHPTLPNSNLAVSPGEMVIPPAGGIDALGPGDPAGLDPFASATGAGIDPLATGGVLGSGV